MKDIINFPVVATKYCNVDLDFIKSIELGEYVELIPEPDNKVDSNAIQVFILNHKVGYVPNRGVSCSICWSGVGGKDNFCTKCGANNEHFVPGGLATRMIMAKIFEKDYSCYVESLDFFNEHMPITVGMVVAHGL